MTPTLSQVNVDDNEKFRPEAGREPEREQDLTEDDAADAPGRDGERDRDGSDQKGDECPRDDGNQKAEPVAVAIGLRLVEGDHHSIQRLLRLRELGQGLRELGDPLIDRRELGLLRLERTLDGGDGFGKVIQLELNSETSGIRSPGCRQSTPWSCPGGAHSETAAPRHRLDR